MASKESNFQFLLVVFKSTIDLITFYKIKSRFGMGAFFVSYSII